VASLPRPEPTRVALYARVSSEEQAEDETIEVQRDFLHRYAELHGKEVAAEYLDDGVSGTIPLEKRPQGGRMLEHAGEGRFGAVLFMRVSRLGRRLGVVLDAYEVLDAAGVVLKSGTEPIDTASAVGRFVFQMLGAFAELDRETIIDNTSRGRARGAQNGRWYGIVPFGYCVRDGKLAANQGEILPGLLERELAGDVLGRIANGSSTVREALRLNSLGVPSTTRHARHDGTERIAVNDIGWTPGRIKVMVRNPVYKGVRVFKGKHGEITREVPALVSPEVWQRANDQLRENRIGARRNARTEYLLRRLIRCGTCGVAYTGAHVTRKGKEQRYYRCTYSRTANRPLPEQRCRGKILTADTIEKAVWEDCERFLRDPGQALEDARAQLAERHGGATDIAAERREWLANLSGKDRERSTILTLLRKGTIRLEEAEQQLDAISGEQAAIQAELDRLANRQAIHEAGEQQIRAAETLLADLRAKLDEGLDDPTRQAVVQALVRQIVVTTGPGTGRARRASIKIDYAFAEQTAIDITSRLLKKLPRPSQSLSRLWWAEAAAPRYGGQLLRPRSFSAPC
jgi:site-specific DNA recombinase